MRQLSEFPHDGVDALSLMPRNVFISGSRYERKQHKDHDRGEQKLFSLNGHDATALPEAAKGLHALCQNLPDLCGGQVFFIAAPQQERAFGDAVQHVRGSPQFPEVEHQPDFLHPGFQRVQPLQRGLFIGLAFR